MIKITEPSDCSFIVRCRATGQKWGGGSMKVIIVGPHLLEKKDTISSHNYRPRSRGDITFGSVRPSVIALMLDLLFVFTRDSIDGQMDRQIDTETRIALKNPDRRTLPDVLSSLLRR